MRKMAVEKVSGSFSVIVMTITVHKSRCHINVAYFLDKYKGLQSPATQELLIEAAARQVKK